MQFQTPFDARQVEPASFPPPPPLADYHVKIVNSEAKPTNDNTGGYLQFDLEILDPGPFLGRVVPYRLNLFSTKSAQSVEIAYKQLSAICHVTQQFQVTDSRQLHGIPFIANIGPQSNNPQYAQVNAVKDLNGNQPGKQSGAPAPTPAPASAPNAWQTSPATAPSPAAAPAWAPPGQPAAPAPAPASTQQPPWAPAGASPAVPPWATK